MSMQPPEILADAWRRLRAGRADAQHPFRTAALATADALGRPDVRTVVLRHVDESTRTIDFQTDHRSPKFDSLRHNASAAWLFYDSADAVQLRIQTSVTLHAADDIADAAWAAVPDAARLSYRINLACGAVLPGPQLPSPAEGEDGRRNFVVARCRIESLEWLKRDAGEWRRVRFTWPAGGIAWQWLVP